MIGLTIAVGVLLLILATVGIAVAYFYRFAFIRRPDERRPWEADPAALSPPGQQYGPAQYQQFIYDHKIWLNQTYQACGQRYTMTSRDGLTLVAHYIPPQCPQRGVYLMVHGYRSLGFSDFSCAVKDMTADGFGCFVIDHRAHGESEGRMITFGVKERYDIVDWAAYIEREFPGMPVILDGVSMGGATVMAAAGLALPSNVRGIIADCGYTTMGAMFRRVIRQWFHLPPWPLIPLVEAFTRLRDGFGFDEVHSAIELAKTSLPVVLAHGAADDFVPYSMAEEIYAAVKDKIDIELVRSPEAGHGLSYLHDRDIYRAAVGRLYGKILDEDKTDEATTGH